MCASACYTYPHHPMHRAHQCSGVAGGGGREAHYECRRLGRGAEAHAGRGGGGGGGIIGGDGGVGGGGGGGVGGGGGGGVGGGC